MMTYSDGTYETLKLSPTSLGSELAGRIEGQIERRASGRVRDLHVACEAGQIILSGRTRTYHAKQLALQAVLDLIDGEASLANQIVVC